MNEVGRDYHLTENSSLRGLASLKTIVPNQEYFKDEADPLKYRLRASTKDVGAFEYGTAGTGIGPYDLPPSGGVGGVGGSGGSSVGGAAGAAGDVQGGAAGEGGSTTAGMG